MLYVNYYKCVCGEEWQSEWDCKCNDKCPVCNKEIEPYKSDSIRDYDNLSEEEKYDYRDELIEAEEKSRPSKVWYAVFLRHHDGCDNIATVKTEKEAIRWVDFANEDACDEYFYIKVRVPKD